jgi:hypothetical protein
MIGMNTETELVETVINATIANVRGTFQIEHFIMVTSNTEDNLVMKMTDTRTALRINTQRELSSLHDKPDFKIRTSLVGMAHKLEELYEKRMSEK